MALSRITYTYSGTNVFAVNFALGYIKAEDVTARVNDEVDGGGSPVYRSLTFLTEGTVAVSGVLNNGDKIVLERTVDADELVHDYADGEIFDDDNFDRSFKQACMLAHQAIDGRFGKLEQDINMNTFGIVNVRNAVDDQDVPSFGQMKGLIGDAPLFAANAAASAAAAAASESNTALLESSAASILAQVQAVYDDFDDRYLGEKATEPTVDNDGDPLEVGALFFNTTENYLMVYSGTMWLALDLSIADGSITQAKLATDSVGTAQIIDANVTEPKIATGAISFVKLKTDNFISSLSEVLTTATNNIARISDLFDYVDSTNKRIFHVQDQKPSGTDGGSVTVGDNDRDLNTVLYNGITDAALSSNQITLPVGTYEIKARAPKSGFLRHRAKLVNVTDSVTTLVGSNAYNSSGTVQSQNDSFIRGVFTIASTKTFKVVTYSQESRATFGLGVAIANGDIEVYTDVWIRKIG